VAIYRNRRHAGRVHSSALSKYAHRDDVVVSGLTRGGISVAYEVARECGAPFDVFVVRELGIPSYPELVMGAIAIGGTMVLIPDVVEQLRIPKQVISAVAQAEARELQRCEQAYRGNRPPIDVTYRIVILIDDRLATGASMHAAIAALGKRKAKSIVVGVLIASPSTCQEIGKEADDIVCAARPEPFHAVGLWYQDFSQTSDDEVRNLLEEAARQRSSSADTTAARK
jgi:putative phosphoribosyl transferase